MNTIQYNTNLLGRYFSRRLSDFPRIPKDSSLNKSPWCQTLSKALNKYINILLTLRDGFTTELTVYFVSYSD